MARKSRVVGVGLPHHVTQRGNDRHDVFFQSWDRDVFLDRFFHYAGRHHLSVWGYCLMSNHVHFVVVPEQQTSLATVFGRVQSDYASYANLLRRGCGHLWQARFYSCPLDNFSAWQALAYVERNPVRAGLVRAAEDYAWSSARAHCRGRDPSARLDLSAWANAYTAERWQAVLSTALNEEAFRERIRLATSVGLPVGTVEFVKQLGKAVGRELSPRPSGRPPKRMAAAGIMG